MMPQRTTQLYGILVVLAGCSPPASDERPNVLLVVIDTVRADKLGCYAHRGGLTPGIDGLAAGGVLFEQATAHAPWTLPSTASLLTSMHPPEHGAGGGVDLRPPEEGGKGVSFQALSPSVATLAEVFRGAGWRTGAVINVDFLDRSFGLTRGVRDVDARWYANNKEVRTASETTREALAWINEEPQRPFFLLAHYFDAHALYNPPAEYRRRFARPVDQESSQFSFGTRTHMALLRSGRLELNGDLIERAEALYEGELAYLDGQVARLFEGLEESGLADNTLVVLTADHGEEFLDHGGFEHGHTLYEELLHVPLIFRFPRQIEAGLRIAPPVGLVDVAPTICELVGLEAPRGFRGQSLAPVLHGTALTPRPVLAYGNFWGPPLVSWRVDHWKLILTPNEGGRERTELYDLSGDPGERHNLADEEPALVDRLRLGLELARERSAARGAGRAVELDPAMRARLESLGYLGAEPADGENP